MVVTGEPSALVLKTEFWLMSDSGVQNAKSLLRIARSNCSLPSGCVTAISASHSFAAPRSVPASLTKQSGRMPLSRSMADVGD